MNAVIALCHFCETHGPKAIFCTQTMKNSKLEDMQSEIQSVGKKCPACTSLGQSNVIYSEDTESGSIFLSTQNPALPEVSTLLTQAAMMSLCESNNKDGGFVFFGDSTRGHVLSHSFNICDLQARGFQQLFSIVILMKDKYFLLNTKPFLAEHLCKISAEMQSSAQKIKAVEEAKAMEAPRQSHVPGTQIEATPRSLIELTDEENIFAILHSHFSWLLLAGSRFLTEHVTFGNLPWLPPESSGKPPQQRPAYNIATLEDPQQEDFYSLRLVKQIVRSEFNAVCYCALTGVKIIVRGSPERTLNLMMCLRKLLPDKMHQLIRIDAKHQQSISSEYKIISVNNDIPVPNASGSVLRIDFLDKPLNGKEVSVKWPSELPSKWPDLLVKLIKAVDESRFTELVLNKHSKALVEEWKNKVICLNRAKSTTGQNKLKKVLGVQPQDQLLISYWSAHLQ